MIDMMTFSWPAAGTHAHELRGGEA